MKFPRSRRITAGAEFRTVRESGRSHAGAFLVLAWRRIDDPSESDPAVPSRFGFVTSRRVGGAVVRNRVRRRLRAIVRELGQGITPGHLVVTVARARAGDASFEQLRREWRWLAHRAGLLPGRGRDRARRHDAGSRGEDEARGVGGKAFPQDRVPPPGNS